MAPFPRLVVALLFATIAGAQAGPIETRAYDLDSGSRDNLRGRPYLVFSGEVLVPEAPWLRLHFADTGLPEGSRLRLTSLEDGASQVFDARSLRDYANGSAVFNGNGVRVEILAGPGTHANRVRVDRVEFGTQAQGAEDSLCGEHDDRQLSYDPRIARAYPSGCTVSLVNEHTFVTAGHCVGQDFGHDDPRTALVMFDVPLSGYGGTWRFPSPDDQYRLDLSTLQTVNTGVGEDWAVVSSFRNSNHRLYAGESQGDWFKIGAVPAGSIAEEDIRITGYGGVGPPLSTTWSWVQKTQVGPAIGTTTGEIRYATDTTGGNSGSPVILERTGELIGIHTDGGCSLESGWNSGTRIDLAGFQDAIKAVTQSKILGITWTFGEGCSGSAGPPLLSTSGIAELGETITVMVAGAPPGETALLAMGFSITKYNSEKLPLAMGPYGMEGCTLYTSVEASVALFSRLGSISYTLEIPNLPSLVGRKAFFQFASLDAGAENALGAVLSNAAGVLIGGSR